MEAPGIEAGIRVSIACVRCRSRLLSPMKSSRRVGKNSTTNPRPFVLPSFSFLFFFLFFFPFFWAGPMPLSSLQAWIIPFTLYLTELYSTRLAPWFLFFLWNICCSSSRDILCCFCPLCFDMVSCTPLGIGHVLQDSPGGLRVLFNAIATPLMLFMTFTVFQNISRGLS